MRNGLAVYRRCAETRVNFTRSNERDGVRRSNMHGKHPLIDVRGVVVFSEKSKKSCHHSPQFKLQKFNGLAHPHKKERFYALNGL